MLFLTKSEKMKELLEKQNGYLLAKDVAEMGISKTYLSEFVNKYGLERVAQGIYMSADTWQDDLYILCLKNTKVILSHETALQVHGLTEREPNSIYVSVPYTYNAKHLREKGITVHQCKNELYELGAIQAVTKYGNTVKVMMWKELSVIWLNSVQRKTLRYSCMPLKSIRDQRIRISAS